MAYSLVRIGSAVLPLVAGLFLLNAPVRAQNEAASLFKSKCAACHGADGSGNTSVLKSMKISDFHSADVQSQNGAQLTDMQPCLSSGQ